MNGARRRPRAAWAFDPERYRAAWDDASLARLHALVEVATPEPLRTFDDEAARDALGASEILLTGWGAPRVTAAALEAAPDLRLIVHLAGSVKEVIDASAFARGIAVTSAADANAVPVAEYTLAAILLAGKGAFALSRAYARERRDHRGLRERTPVRGNYRVVVGVVGASRVGRLVVERLRAFDVAVVLYDPYLDAAQARALGARAVSLEALLRESDVVSLHAPATEATRAMLDAERLGLMKEGATLINTARGSLVDAKALVRELSSGRISAVLDVTEPEPLPPDSPLYELPNVFLTPHLAGAVGPERARLVAAMLDEIERYVKGEALRHLVDAAALEWSA